MAWYFNSKRVFVTDLGDGRESIIAELNPLGGGSVFQYFGWREPEIQVTAYVVSEGELQTVLAPWSGGTSAVLSGPFSTINDSYIVDRLEYRIMPWICQTIRQDLPDDSPVFQVTMNLRRDL